MNQLELEAKTRCLRQAREMRLGQVPQCTRGGVGNPCYGLYGEAKSRLLFKLLSVFVKEIFPLMDQRAVRHSFFEQGRNLYFRKNVPYQI